MPKVIRVKAARKAQGNCGKCGDPIEVGDSYVHWSHRLGRMKTTKKRCGKAQCYPRASDLTMSKMAGVYRAQEDYQDAAGDGTDPVAVAAALESAADEIEAVGEEYKESAQNIEDGFGTATYQSEELNEKGEALCEWAEEIRQAASEIENMDVPDEPDEPELLGDDEADEPLIEEHRQLMEEYEEAMSELESEIEDRAAIIDECPV